MVESVDWKFQFRSELEWRWSARGPFHLQTLTGATAATNIYIIWDYLVVHSFTELYPAGNDKIFAILSPNGGAYETHLLAFPSLDILQKWPGMYVSCVCGNLCAYYDTSSQRHQLMNLETLQVLWTCDPSWVITLSALTEISPDCYRLGFLRNTGPASTGTGFGHDFVACYLSSDRDHVGALVEGRPFTLGQYLRVEFVGDYFLVAEQRQRLLILNHQGDIVSELPFHLRTGVVHTMVIRGNLIYALDEQIQLHVLRVDQKTGAISVVAYPKAFNNMTAFSGDSDLLFGFDSNSLNVFQMPSFDETFARDSPCWIQKLELDGFGNGKVVVHRRSAKVFVHLETSYGTSVFVLEQT